MSRRRVIRPRPVPDWPTLFWARAESSYCGNDLECRGGCLGTGLLTRPLTCPRCRGSGLLVPRRTPARPRELTPAEPAWVGVRADQLAWPLPWLWEVPLLLVSGAGDLYSADDEVLAFMNAGRLCLALFRLDGEAGRRLEEAYRLATGERATVPRFVLPEDRET